MPPESSAMDDATAQAMAALLGSVQTRLLVASAMSPPFINSAATKIHGLGPGAPNTKIQEAIDSELIGCLRVADRLIALAKINPPTE